MSAIPFTDRELKQAWRELSDVAMPGAGNNRQNPHRLLLFYAVECGLKAVWLKRQSRSVFDSADINRTSHNLRRVLKDLNVGAELSFHENFRLTSISHHQAQLPRNGNFGELHQVWRYGGKCVSPTDHIFEQQLQKVLTWIQGELK